MKNEKNIQKEITAILFAIVMITSVLVVIPASAQHGYSDNGILVMQWKYDMQSLYTTLRFGSSAAIADLGVNTVGGEPDEDLEIVTGSDEYNNFYPELGTTANGIWRCFDSQGNLEWAKDTGTDESRSSPAIADFLGDSYLEIVGGTTSGWNVEVMDRFGNFVWTFPWPPQQAGPFMWHSSPAVADVDPSISGLEVFIGNNPYNSVWALDGDNSDGVDDGITATDLWINGTEGIDWDVLWKFDTLGPVWSSPALGDVDNDEVIEVVIGSQDSNVYVLNGITGALEWNYSTGGIVDSSAAIADLDSDGYLEMAIGSADGNIYCLQWDGSTGTVEWTYSTMGPVYSSPAIGDVDADGYYEIVVGSDDKNVYCLNDSGSLEWSYLTGDIIQSSAALANRGTGDLDVYIGSYDTYLYLIDGNTGSLIDRFLTYGPLYTSPSVADADGDGKLEIFLYDAGNWSIKNNYTFWAIEDSGSQCDTYAIEWGMFRHDQQRTGLYPNQPPDCSEAYADPSCLWPVNHKFVDIAIEGVTDPDGDEVTINITGITSDEQTATLEGAGDEIQAPDAAGVGTDTASVRAERSGTGNGRVYEITFVARDGKGGECEGSVKVCVPHDVDKGKDICDCVDDGQIYDATAIN